MVSSVGVQVGIGGTPGVWLRRIAPVALAVLAAATAAQAAPASLPGSVEPGRDRPLPEAPPPPPAYDFRIEAPHRSPVPRDVDTVRFKLSDIRIEGAKTLSPESFRPLYSDLIGKEITLANIFDIADAIEAQYRRAGYPLVRAYVPPQRVSDGVFTIRIVEGFIAALSIEGGSPDLQARIRSYMAPALASHPLKLSLIERGLLLANDLPGVTANGVLKPSASVEGASDLIVTVAQPTLTGGIAADNRGSHFSGIWTITGDATLDGIFDGEDSLSASITASPSSLEQIGGQVRYSHPILDDGLMASFLGVITHGEPGSTLSAFNVRTDSYAVGPRLTYPVLRSRAETLILDGGITVQNAKVDILGTGISHDNWRVVDIAASYSNNDVVGGSLGATLDVAQGIPGLGATHDGSADLSRLGGKTDFTKFVGSARYMHPLFWGFSAFFAAEGQYGFSPMLTGEQITFGGRQIGRGYDPGAITGDRGIGGSAELRYDWRFAVHPLLMVEPYGFYDTAAAWYDNRGSSFDPSLHDETIASTGAGLRFWFDYDFTTDIEVARTLRAVPGSDGGSKTTKVLVDAAIRF
jgi:hemolysin activation/secretion protein